MNLAKLSQITNRVENDPYKHMNYDAIVQSLRDSARDQLRLKLVNNRRANILVLQNGLNSATKWAEDRIESLKKLIAISEYKLSKLDKADPEYAEKQEEYTKKVEDSKQIIAEVSEGLNKTTKEYSELIKEQQDGIAKIQSGETKVNKEEMTAITNNLIEELGDEAVKSKLTEIMAQGVSTDMEVEF